MYRTTLPNTPGIYVIINVVNHHCYVGSTTRLQHRRQDHFRELKKGKHKNAHLQSAYDCYGQDAFIFVVLEYVASVHDLVAREQHHMDFLKPEYNLAPQAGRTTGIKRSPEYVARLTAVAAAANRGRSKSRESIALGVAVRRANREAGLRTPRVLTPESLAKRRATIQAKVDAGLYKAPNTGRRWSAEVIAKRSATVRAKYQAGEWVPHNKGKKHSASSKAKIKATLLTKNEAKRLAKQQEALRLLATLDTSPPSDLDITQITPRPLWDDLA